MESKRFNIGYLQADLESSEEMFLSVSPGMEMGPGIIRDGITKPRMTDPHCVAYVTNAINSNRLDLRYTQDPYEQRSGTWTIYHHLKNFIAKNGNDWQVVGVQSCGDLTMNPWHIAYINTDLVNIGNGGKPYLSGLLTDGDDNQEPFHDRVYRSLIKWTKEGRKRRGKHYEVLDVRFSRIANGYRVDLVEDHSGAHQGPATNIEKFIEFALSGKPIIEKGNELALHNTIDRFKDVRHIFNLPTVSSEGFFNGEEISQLNFGEYSLYSDLNVRRLALFAPVIIPTKRDWARVDIEMLKEELKKKHFSEVQDSPSKRGQYRMYNDGSKQGKVEIFFSNNVYPFGVIGLSHGKMVALASGGLSGRIGNTLDGITRMMYDFFGCSEAMVLDEGLDTFQLANRYNGGSFQFSNKDLLDGVLSFTKSLSDEEHNESKGRRSYYEAICSHTVGGMKEFPLNKKIFEEIDNDFNSLTVGRDFSEMISVPPHRTQIRSVVIFAKRKNEMEGQEQEVKKKSHPDSEIG